MSRFPLLPVVLVASLVAFAVAAGVPVADPVWWVRNEQPPALTLAGADRPVRGETEVAVRIEPADRARIVQATIDGSTPATVEADRLRIDTRRLPDGPHRLVVVAQDTSLRQNATAATWAFTSRNTPPPLDVALDPAVGPRLGRTLVVRVRSAAPLARVDGRLGEHALRFQSDGRGGFWAVDGTAPDAPAASLPLDLSAVDEAGNPAVETRSLPVEQTAFAEDDLELTPELARLLTPETLANEEARFRPHYRGEAGPARWSGPFRRPVAGTITTEFGTRRSYENHPGADFAVPLGTPVLAPADGRVVAVEETPLRGGTLVLDHGAGVYTTYAHLEGVDVAVGDEVQAGQQIARAGNSGLSTGAHLHWEVWVNDAAVDPLEWTRRAFP